MKKRLYKLMCYFVVVCCSFVFSGCEPKVKYPGLDSGTKSYYSKNGYLSFAVSSDLKVETPDEDDIVNFDDGTSMIKKDIKIKIVPADAGYILTDYGFYINLKTGKVLSKLEINERLYSYADKDYHNYTVSNSLDIKAVINDFNMVGVMCLIDKSYVVNENKKPLNQIMTVSDSMSLKSDYLLKYSLYYAYLSSQTNYEIVTSNKFKSNVSFNCKKSDDGKSVNFIFELFFNKSVTSAYVVLKDSENRLFIHEIDFDSDKKCFTINNETENNITGVDNISLSFSTNLSSS